MPNPPIYLEFDGRRQTREEWSREKNIPISTLRSRLERRSQIVWTRRR